MWGGGPDRNMVSEARNLPVAWDVARKANVRWVAELGTQTFGNPVVSGGKIFIGTNNGQPRNPAITGDKGVLMCFAASDGRFLWQAVHDKLAAGNSQDWQDIGLCSAPCVVGNRLYYVSNRGELVCADTEGFLDNQNDGPITDEPRAGKTDADLVWVLDMIGALGVVPMYASASSPLVVGDLVFVLTGNGVDDKTGEVKTAKAPSFAAVHRETGAVVWTDNSPGERILAGQWSSPAYGIVNGEPQVVFPGGDGWLYAFEPQTGKLIWKFNCQANQTPPGNGKQPKNQLVATPVYYDNKVFIAIGQDPESGDGEGCLWAVDATGRGDVTGSAGRWHIAGKEFGRSASTVAIRDGLLYAAEVGGYLNCLDVRTGQRYWRFDLKATVWASPLVADGRVYISNADGDVWVFKHGKDKADVLATNHLPGSVHGTVIATDGVLYLADRSHLYAIAPP